MSMTQYDHNRIGSRETGRDYRVTLADASAEIAWDLAIAGGNSDASSRACSDLRGLVEKLEDVEGLLDRRREPLHRSAVTNASLKRFLTKHDARSASLVSSQIRDCVRGIRPLLDQLSKGTAQNNELEQLKKSVTSLTTILSAAEL